MVNNHKKSINVKFNIDEKKISNCLIAEEKNVKPQTFLKILILLTVFSISSIGNLYGQLTTTTYNFASNSTGWTGNFTRSTLTNATMCGSAGMRKNLWSNATTGYLVSPQLPGTNNLGEITLTFNYKAANYSSPYGAANPWGSFNVQVGNSASGPWTTISTVSQETQTGSCITKTITFTPPAGNLFIKWDCFWTAGDYYLSFDDITISQAAPVACSGTPNPGTASISSNSGCSGSSISLNASGLSSGVGITYQWESGPSSSGPWTNISGATNNSTNITSVDGTTYYRLTTTCSSSGLTNSSNSISYSGTTCGIVPTSGNNSYTLCSGVLYDNGGSSGNYANNSNGYSVITPSTAGTYAEVSGSGNAESNYDFLHIYDGIGTGGTLLWSWVNQGSGAFTVPTITSITGSLTIQFTSDTSVNYSGFALNINCSPTPGTAVYCTPSISATYYPPTNYIREIAFLGTLQDISNTSTFDSTSPYGYEDFTGLVTKSIQAQGEGVNIYLETVSSGYYKAWVDWNNDGDFADAGETVYDVGGISQSSTTFGFVIPPSTTPGDYRVRVRMSGYNSIGSDAGSSWGSCDTTLGYYGETEDYLFTVVASCSANIDSITDGERCGTGTVDLTVTGTAGVTGFNWYANATGGSALASTATGSWTTPSISTTTTYYVTATNGSCESLVRVPIVAKISPTPTVTFTPSSPFVCGEEAVQLTAGGDKELAYLIDESFDSGLGVFTNSNFISNGASIDNITMWQNQTSTFVPYEQTWYPAISSGFGPNTFAMATSDVGAYDTHNAIVSPTINSTDFLNLTLQFKMYHSRYYVNGNNTTLEYVNVEISTDNGVNWTVLENITADVGIGTNFALKSYDLSSYLNQTQLKFRIVYYAEWCDGLAIDDFEVFGEKPLNTAFNYDTSDVQAFTDAACTITYTSSTPATTIWVKPTLTQLASGTTFNIPVTAVLSNGCLATGSIDVTNNTKVFKAGTAGTDWNNATNWGPSGLPTADNCVIIEDDDVNLTGSGFNGLGLNLTVKHAGNLNIEAGNTLTITDFVNIESGGVLEIQDDASLVQINDVNNTGNALVHRVTTGSPQDYVYWSSPVDGFNTPTSGYVYRWDPVYTNPNGSQGYWIGATNTSMAEGKGYIIRDIFSRDFSGVLRNGNVSIGIQRGSFTTAGTSSGVAYTKDDDDWNLLGNPYPSAISVNSFLAANNDSSTGIQGAVYIWRHNIALSSANPDPFYEDFVQNYDVNSYIVHNGTGSSPAGYNGFIPSGQGFFVNMVDGGATSSSVVFNNSMRSAGYDNSQFYRTSSSYSKNMFTAEEKHRIWLEISDSNNNSVTTLVGYIENATNEYDNLYDAIPYAANTFNIYSLINTEKYLIQGRTLPFDVNDQVPLGFLVPNDGIYTIGINQVDGLFETNNQDIYLEDLQVGIIHDLRVAPYSFTATSGYNGTRFVLRYTNETLGNENFTNNNVFVYTNESINIDSTNTNIKEVIVYDLLGRSIYRNANVNAKTLNISEINATNSGLIVNITLENGNVKSEKIIY